MSDSPKVTHTFSSGHSITALLTLLLAVCVLIDLIAIAFGYSRPLLIAAYFITGVVFVIWVDRARRNVLAVGNLGRRFASPWSIALFFVPIFNLYHPYDMVRELWKQSNPDVGLSDAFLKRHASTLEQYSSKTVLIGLWWGFVIASIVVARISGLLPSDSAENPALITQSRAGMISDALRVVGSITLIVVVSRIDARLEEKHRRRALDRPTQQVAHVSRV